MNDIEINDEVLDVWVGKNNRMNEKVKTTSFNWCAFLFGGYYFLYRKMYLIGILDMVIDGILTFLLFILASLVNPILGIFTIAIPIVNGFIFSPLYKMHIRNVLNKNVNKNLNPIQVAQMKGGVNAGAVGIAIGVVFLLGMILGGILMIIGVAIISIISPTMLNDDYYSYDNYDNYYNYDDYDYDYNYDDDFYERFNDFFSEDKSKPSISGYDFNI